MTAVVQACGALQPHCRDQFLRALAAKLRGHVIGDGSLSRAIRDLFASGEFLMAQTVAVGKAVRGAGAPGSGRRSKLLEGEPLRD
jgi:hypothetical protein